MVLSLTGIISLLIAYKYLILLPITILEGPIVAIIGGFLASLGYLNFFLVYIVALTGDLIGDAILYYIGRTGRVSLIEKFGRYFARGLKKVEQLDVHFEQHSGKTLLIGKFTHGLGLPILIAAGMAKMPFGKFIFFNTIGSAVKCLAFVTIGYYFGSAYQMFNKYLNWGSLAILAIAVIIVAVFIFLKMKRKKTNQI